MLGLGVGVGVGVGLLEGNGVGLALGALGVALPLSQTSFFPDLMQVKVTFPDVVLSPSCLQLVPAFTAPKAGGIKSKVKVKSMPRNFLMKGAMPCLMK